MLGLVLASFSGVGWLEMAAVFLVLNREESQQVRDTTTERIKRESKATDREI